MSKIKSPFYEMLALQEEQSEMLEETKASKLEETEKEEVQLIDEYLKECIFEQF